MIGANRMIVGLIGVFVLAMLGAALTDPLQDQVDSWEENLTTAGQTAAGTVVALIPLLFLGLLSVGLLLAPLSPFPPRTSRGSSPWGSPPHPPPVPPCPSQGAVGDLHFPPPPRGRGPPGRRMGPDPPCPRVHLGGPGPPGGLPVSPVLATVLMVIATAAAPIMLYVT